MTDLSSLSIAELLRLRRHLQTSKMQIHRRELMLMDCVSELMARGVTEAAVAKYDAAKEKRHA